MGVSMSQAAARPDNKSSGPIRYLRDKGQLDLSNMDIDGEQAQKIAKELATNTTLTELNLRCNRIGDNGAAAIGRALTQNQTLTAIWLEGNQISDDGATALATALTENTTLTHLYLYKNGIGPVGAAAMADTLGQNTCLSELDLGGNAISDSGAVAVARCSANQHVRDQTVVEWQWNWRPWHGSLGSSIDPKRFIGGT
jgi:NLR family CARD domain-containing protein 3